MSYVGMRAQAEVAQEPAQDPDAWLKSRHASVVMSRRAPSGKMHAVVACSLFLVLVLFAATLLVGGRAALGPILQSAAEERDSRSAGDVVYTMPDGVFCRHVSYDNVTGELTAGNIEPCKSDVSQDRWHVTRRFTWQSN
jgi:hypothetical protein